MYCLELMKFDVSSTSYCAEVENGELLHDVTRSWKMITGGHGKVVENFFREKVWELCNRFNGLFVCFWHATWT